MKIRLRLRSGWSWLAVVLGLLPSLTAQAATYILPKGDVVGQAQYASASGSETVAEIARHYDVGISAVISANPHLKAASGQVRPAAGTRILIPGRHILPSGPRQGIVINLADMQLYYYSAPFEPPDPQAAKEALMAALKEAEKAAPAVATSTTSNAPAVKEAPQDNPKAAPAVVASGAAPETAKEAAKVVPAAAASAAAPEAAKEPPQAAPKVTPEPAAGVAPLLVSVYPISIGSEARSLAPGGYKVEQRLSRPSWSVPASVRSGQPRLPGVMAPGPNNPLGEFAIILDNGDMIHGTNNPGSIGMKVGRGGVSMYPEDIDLLIHRISGGTPVRVVNEPVKHGYKRGALYLEFHKPESAKGELNLAALVNWMSGLVTAPLDAGDWQRVQRVAEASSGIAMPVLQLRGKPRAERGWWLQLTGYKTAKAAHALINKIEAMEVPLAIKGCYEKQPCRVVAGPYKERHYIEELSKKIKWVTGVKGAVVPYREEDDFQMPPSLQKGAGTQ